MLIYTLRNVHQYRVKKDFRGFFVIFLLKCAQLTFVKFFSKKGPKIVRKMVHHGLALLLDDDEAAAAASEEAAAVT